MAPQDVNTGLTSERLKSLLDYNPETGDFSWRVWRPNGVKVGDIAGAIHKKTGYRRIKIDGRPYQASRLAWLYMTGEWPVEIVDHKDLDRSNNRWCNLRAATEQENQRNRTKPRNNTSGFKGVSFKKDAARAKPWAAYIRVDGLLKTIGYFHTPEEAGAAYNRAAREHFGTFARS